MRALLAHLLDETPPAPIASLDELRARIAPLGARFAAPFDRAVAGGFASDRLGYAFAAGYRAALAALAPSLPEDASYALCASEEGGAHPRAIATRIDVAPDGSMTLVGRKRWATMVPGAEVLLVVASTGMDEGRNRLRVVRIEANRPGVVATAMPAPPFAPEIPHGEVRFDARVDEGDLLEGDGWTRWLKPFRTVEDLHVLGALVGYLVAVARTWAWPREIVEDALAVIGSLRALADSPPDAREVHIALGGASRGVHRLVDGCAPHWATVDPEVRARWERDQPLLQVAGAARAKRLEAAWQARARS